MAQADQEGDIDQEFRDVCAQSGRPLYRRLLDIQQIVYDSKDKQIIWRFVDSCSESRRNLADGRIRLNLLPPVGDYIAVSCPWEPDSEPKNSANEKYCVENAFHRTEKVHDIVLDRVLRFAESKGCPFWIDKLCVDQKKGSKEKRIAIQSMDLVYMQSHTTLGLLFVRLDRKGQVERLEHLLRGHYAPQTDEHYGDVGYYLDADHQEAITVLNLIDLILSDKWWERAWIFQEDHLSGLRMLLLIQSSQYHGESELLGDLPGELQVRAANFRFEVTVFCIAVLQQPYISDSNRDRCHRILRRAGKYNILCTQEPFAKDFQAMSPVIFRDTGRREAKHIWDKIAIASNCCEYTKRLDLQELLLQRHKDARSMSVAILAVYVLNGEILRHDRPSTGPDDGDVFDFLLHNTLGIEPPLDGEKALTFKKHCRLPDVVLSPHGIHTKGIIWKLSGAFPVWVASVNFTAEDMSHQRTNGIGPFYAFEKQGRACFLHDRDLAALEALASWLNRSSYECLAKRFTRFIEDVATTGFSEDWTYHHVRSIMAISIAQAIRKQEQLRLACVYREGRYSPYTAIFIAHDDSINEEYFALTSWRMAGAVGTGDTLLTSLEVELLGYPEGFPVIRPKRWLNGVCFCREEDTRDLMIPWPMTMTA